MQRFQKLTPCLWFDDQAEAAAKFYCSIFDHSKITGLTHYSKVGQEFHGKPEGAVMTVSFELDGQTFTGLNGGPMFKFSEAISFQVNCQIRKKSTTSGATCRPVARSRPSNAAGSRTSSGCRGRSCRWRSCT